LQLKVRHLYPNNEVATRFNGDRWSYGLNMKTKVRRSYLSLFITADINLSHFQNMQDFDVEYLRPVRAGKLIIRQKIPNGRWELFPTPEFKVSPMHCSGNLYSHPPLRYDASFDLTQLCTTPVVRGSLKDEVDVGYDLLAHRGAVPPSQKQ
jgi:hypothetical protein